MQAVFSKNQVPLFVFMCNWRFSLHACNQHNPNCHYFLVLAYKIPLYLAR